jgi:hypothetical protein
MIGMDMQILHLYEGDGSRFRSRREKTDGQKMEKLNFLKGVWALSELSKASWSLKVRKKHILTKMPTHKQMGIRATEKNNSLPIR